MKKLYVKSPKWTGGQKVFQLTSVVTTPFKSDHFGGSLGMGEVQFWINYCCSVPQMLFQLGYALLFKSPLQAYFTPLKITWHNAKLH